MIEVLEPASLNLFTADEVKMHLRIEHSDEDAYLNDLIKIATAWIEQYLSRSLLKRKMRLIWEKRRRAFMLSKIPLMYPPIMNIESVKDFIKDQPIKRVTYELYGHQPVVIIGERYEKAEVTYFAGYGEKPGDVPSDIRHAVMMAVQILYERPEGDLNVLPFAQLLKPYRSISVA